MFVGFMHTTGAGTIEMKHHWAYCYFDDEEQSGAGKVMKGQSVTVTGNVGEITRDQYGQFGVRLDHCQFR